MTCELEVLPPQPHPTTGPERQALPRPSPQRASLPSRGRALLEEHFVLVRRRLDRLSRTSGLPEHEADEFLSWALFKLVENDYRILGSWEGRSSFSTYLTVALVNLLRDYRIHVWGKWRPSAAACRQGPEAVLLERLRFRDRLPLSEAIDRVRADPGSHYSREELERLAGRLPERIERRIVGEEELSRIAVDGNVEERVREGEGARLAARVHERLLALLRALPAEDRLLLKLHFQDSLTIAAMSSVLRLPQKQLYYRRDRCLKKLRRALLEDKRTSEEANELLASSWCGLLTDRETVWE
ncbi:MAG TPA: sigma-70 family RNA polymerase sigma factor [Thermoanaerobaculia bacterium]|jgi:RNA polymerase sigma factor (sigma-70 family)|nr:sigma-70 family RNA polymerase sigma factor [Thermoanaerobaculia bacterium]